MPTRYHFAPQDGGSIANLPAIGGARSSSPSPSRNTLGVPPSHKPSVPINLQPYVSEALGTASDHIGRTASLRKISLVKASPVRVFGFN